MARFSDSVWRRWTFFIFFRGLGRFDGLDSDDGGEPLTLGEDASRDVDDDDDDVEEEEEEPAILSGSERTFRTCRDGRPGEMDNDVVRGDGGRLLSRILALVFVLSKEEGHDATVCRLDMQPGGVNADERAREDRTHKATVVRVRAAAYVVLLLFAAAAADDDDECRWSAFASVCSPWSPGRFRRIL